MKFVFIVDGAALIDMREDEFKDMGILIGNYKKILRERDAVEKTPILDDIIPSGISPFFIFLAS